MLGDNNPTLKTVSLDEVGETPTKTPEGKDLNADLGDFFQTLEKQVNGAVYSEEGEQEGNNNPDLDTGKQVDASDPEPTTSEVGELKKELESLKTRYESSSSEAKRLHEELQNLQGIKEYEPLINTMREDPGLISTVREYLEGSQTPKSIKDELSLPEDFVFDGDEAVTDPGSTSAKVLDNMISKGVEKKLTDFQKRQEVERRQAQARQDQIRSLKDFKSKMEMSDEEFDNFRKYAESRSLTLEDIYYLMNREKRDSEIAKKAIEDREKQLLKMKGTPKSMASTGAHSEPLDHDVDVFNMIKKSADNYDIFGSEVKED